MESNFDFLMKNEDTQSFYRATTEAERSYTEGSFDTTFIQIRKVIENVARMVLDLAYIEVSDHSTFNDQLREIRNHRLVDKSILDLFYDLKRYGNSAAHTLSNPSKGETLMSLRKLDQILVWFFNSIEENGTASTDDFFEPHAEKLYQTAERKLIYVQTADNTNELWPAYKGLEKIGDASSEDPEINNQPNSEDLRAIAEKRIRQYMNTAGVPHKLQWAELAYSKKTKTWFRDYDVHEVLLRSGIKKNEITTGNEWYQTDVETVKKAITAVKDGKKAIDVAAPELKITLRPEQADAVKKTVTVFKHKNKMLWNAKMRFGKTISALKLIKQEKYQKVLIMTHRPVVSDSWFTDFGKMKMSEAGYKYGSRNKGNQLESLVNGDESFIYFASIQDLRGSTAFGGHVGDKNELVAATNWDLVIIDEAHEGTQTDLAQQVIKGVIKPDTKLLELSGTPFNLLDQYDDGEVYTWDYVMEQQAKYNWDKEHPNEPNPYAVLPKVSMYTFEMKRNFDDDSFIDIENKAFNFSEFFKVNDEGKFVHELKVNQFLNNITTQNAKTNYPFSTAAFRNELRHMLWLLPSIKAAKALKELMDKHPVFGKEYQIINIVDNGDSMEGTATESDLERVRSKITDDPASTKTITLTVRKLTTGVNIKEWTAVIFLSNTTSAMQYLQAAFRAQTPFSNEKLGMKTNSYIFDFAPDRALTIMAASTNLSTAAGKRVRSDQKQKMSELLNFLPIIGERGQGMQAYKVDSLLTKLKRVYAEKAVSSGFDDDSLYSDELLMLDEADLSEFNDLKALVGSTKSEKKPSKVDVNKQGLTDEEYDQANKALNKKKKERTADDQAAIDKMNSLKKQRKTMISILRSISIRIPMMIYGMNIDITEDVDIDTFIQNVDEQSWNEFMPKGVTKGKFKQFIKYYDPDVFIEAGRIIRRRVKKLDNLDPIERTEKIAEVFSTFKNPDKETVLTPWRVVNMQLGKTIGGLSFFDADYQNSTKDGVGIRHWIETSETDGIFHDKTHILEINSKTGLYPLYVATSLYFLAFSKMNNKRAGKFSLIEELDIWKKILKENIFVVAKTPMAKTITERTLFGYRETEMNIKYIDGIVATAKQSIDDGVKRIKGAFDNMKFDVVVGNPPYQEEAGGTSSSDRPIYHLFMDMAYSLSKKSILITPARFLFRAGATPSAWNEKMLSDVNLKVVSFEQKSDQIFPHTDIKGGIAITLHDKDKNFGKIGTFTPFKELKLILEKVQVDLKQGCLTDIIYSQNKLNLDVLYKDFPKANAVISSNGQDRRLESNIFSKLSIFSNDPINSNSIKILGLVKNRRIYKYVDSKYIDLSHENLQKFKVLLPKSNGSGALGEVVSTPLIGTPFIGYTRSFLGIGAFESEIEAQAALKYVKSKFARTMLGILKVTQDNNPEKWSRVPLQDFTSNSDIDWTKSIHEIDQQLYAKYGLSDQEIEFIETKVQEMN